MTATSMPGMQKLYQAAQAAGMDVQYWEAPGLGHDWACRSPGLAHVMPWLGQRMGITAASRSLLGSTSPDRPRR